MTDRNLFVLWLVLFVLLATVSPAAAETFQVTTTDDDDGACLPDDCSLREALIAANDLPGRDTVLVPAGTYRVEIPGLSGAAGSFDIRDDLDLVGEPGTIFQGDKQDRVLAVARPFFGAPPVYAVIRSVIFQGGRGEGNGGGVRVSGSDLTLIDCVVRNNYATDHGGGIGVNVAGLHLIRTSVIDNEAALDGGGVFRIGVVNSPTPSVLEIVNSTIAHNRAFQGGGIGMRLTTESFILRNSTVAHNTAEFRSDAVSIIDPDLRESTFLLANNILADDLDSSTCGFDGFTPTSLGGNVASPGIGCRLGHPTDLEGSVDVGLGELTYDLGPTPVMPLLPGSPAIDAGVDAECEAEDQRGVARPRDGDGDGTPRCDAGAVELGASPAVIPVAGWPGLLAFAAALAATAWWALRTRTAPEWN